jgi:predicted PurR-regulated permease PerM
MTTRPQHFGFWLATLAALVAAVALFREILLPFVSGIAIAYFLNPVADRLERAGLPRGLAAALIVGLTAVLAAFALILLVPLLAAQLKQLALTVPAEAERLRLVVEQVARDRFGTHFPALQGAIERAFADIQSGWASSAGQIFTALWSRGMALVNVVSLLLITPLVVFYLLVDWHRMLRAVETWVPRDHVGTIRQVAGEIDQAVAAFIRGQGTICLLLGLFYAVGLSLVGLKYGLVIGLGTGLLGFVPVAGWALGLIVSLGLAVAQFGLVWWPLLLVALVLVAGLAMDTAFLSPRLVGEQVGLHPVWLIFALFAFSYLLGFVGTLIAVPLAAAVVVIVRHALQIYKESDVYTGRTTPPTAADPGRAV